jgi:endoglycosylceramidase
MRWLIGIVAIGCALAGISACGSESLTAIPTAPSTAGPVCTLAAPRPPDWRLVADGTRLADGLGRTVFLHGVNAGGRSKFAPYVPFDFLPGQFSSTLESYMARAESWGINAMRVPFTWAALEPQEGQNDEAWLAMYADLLASAWAHGIYTIIDFHQDIYSEVYCGDGFPGWTVLNPPAPHHDCPGWSARYISDPNVVAAFDRFWSNSTGVQTKYLAAWDRMIARFADTPGVLGFEPINEPAAGSESEATFENTTLTNFHREVASHMRAQAPNSLIFVDPAGVNGTTVKTHLGNPGVAGVVFAPHYYPIFFPSPAGVVSGLRQWADVGSAWNVPVWVGEFGGSNTDPHGADNVAAVFAAVDQLGLAGAVDWEYSVSAEQWNAESASVVAADGTEYPVAQALIRPFVRAVAGSIVTQTWDAASKTFTLSYTPASAATDVTEVRLPSRAYPAGYTVQIAGGCYDAASVPGELLVKAQEATTPVTLTVAAQ